MIDEGKDLISKGRPCVFESYSGNRYLLSFKVSNLMLHFVSPYQILHRIWEVAYQIALPPPLAKLHNVFHVSQLRRYILDLSHVVQVDDV